MTITRPAAPSALLLPRLRQALDPRGDAWFAAIRRDRRPSRHPARVSASVPPITLWQIDRDELDSALEHSHW